MGVRGGNGNAFNFAAPPSFHSGESRNLILATARIFREAEHCNGRLSANAAVAAEIPAYAGMEEGAGMEGGSGNGSQRRE